MKTFKDKYIIRKLEGFEYDEAIVMILRNHYLHRRPPCSYAFGLLEQDGDDSALFFPKDRLVGVITYGMPASASLCKGICGEDNYRNVIELTRLWIDDSIPKNGESFLIGNTLKMLDEEIIVSYSEPHEGHLGVVYQATNWIYTGLSEKRTDRVFIDGSDKKHGRHVNFQDVEDTEERTKIVDRPRKHRYVFFNCNKRRKRELMKALSYPILPYPKGAKDAEDTNSN